jgi:hypothetical protein
MQQTFHRRSLLHNHPPEWSLFGSRILRQTKNDEHNPSQQLDKILQRNPFQSLQRSAILKRRSILRSSERLQQQPEYPDFRHLHRGNKVHSKRPQWASETFALEQG